MLLSTMRMPSSWTAEAQMAVSGSRAQPTPRARLTLTRGAGPDDLALNHTVVSREMYERDRKSPIDFRVTQHESPSPSSLLC